MAERQGERKRGGGVENHVLGERAHPQQRCSARLEILERPFNSDFGALGAALRRSPIR